MIGFREDYFIDVRESQRGWGWEIRRKSEAMGVRIASQGFRTRLEAKMAGERELKTFLDRVAREMNRQKIAQWR